MTDPRIGRRQKLVVALAGLTRSASGGMLGTALAVYVGRGGSPVAVGLLSAGFFAGMMVFAPLWGALGDLTGRRKSLLLIVSVASTVLAAAFLLVAGNVPGLVGMRAVYAVFAVGFGPLIISIVGSLSTRDHRGRSVGFISSAMAAGDMGGQVLVGILLGLIVPAELFLVVAVIGFLATVVAVFVADPDAGKPPDEPENPSVGTVLRQAQSRLLPTRDERAALRRTGLTTLYGALALRHAAVKGVGALVPIYLLVNVDVSEATMGLLLTVPPAAQILLMTMFGRIADVGSRRQLVLLGMAFSGGYGLLLAAASYVPGPARFVPAVGGFLAIAVGFSAMDIGVIALIGDAVPPSREAAFIGLRSTASGLGGVVGPLVVGGLATAVGIAPAFALSGVLAFLAAIVVLATLVEPERRSEPATEFRSVETATGIVRPPGQYRNTEAGNDD